MKLHAALRLGLTAHLFAGRANGRSEPCAIASHRPGELVRLAAGPCRCATNRMSSGSGWSTLVPDAVVEAILNGFRRT